MRKNQIKCESVPAWQWALAAFLWLLGVVLAIMIGCQPASGADLQARELVAAVLILEAGGERQGTDGLDGMRAVREVIATRAASRRKTEHEIVLAPKQFSCLNGITTEAAISKAKRHKLWPAALRLAVEPPGRLTRGSNHYHAANIARPWWAVGREPVAAIGNHIFYRLY